MDSGSGDWWMRHRIALLAAILVVGAVGRFLWLDAIPPYLYHDEAMNGLDALRALESGELHSFYPDNNGREGLFVNLTAIAVRLFGPTAWSVRATSAAAGVLTLLAMACLAHEVGLSFWAERKERERMRLASALMLTATGLLAVGVWHVHFSRIGFRVVLLPLFATTGLASLLYGLRTRRMAAFALSGASLGLAFSAHIASRILPLVFIVPLAFSFWKRPDRSLLRNAAGLVASAMIVGLPLIAYFAVHPDDFVRRAAAVSVFAVEDSLSELAVSTAKTLGMFHMLGDRLWRHGYPYRPVLDPLTGSLLLVGVGLLIHRLRRSETSWLLAAWLGAMLLPAALTITLLPHASRSLGASVPVILIAAIGGVWLWERVGLERKLRLPVLIAFASLLVAINAHQYFALWASAPELYGAFRGDMTHLSDYLQKRITLRESAVHDLTRSAGALEPGDVLRSDLESQIDAIRARRDFVIVNEPLHVPLGGIPMPSAVPRYLTRDHPSVSYLTEKDVARIVLNPGETVIAVTLETDEAIDVELREAFPLVERISMNGFWVYRVTR